MNDRQVVWFEYNAAGLISVVRDLSDRRVVYTYTAGNLTGVRDVLSNTTTYEYDNDGRITGSVDAAGRPTLVTYDGYGNVSKVVDRYGKGHFYNFNFDVAKHEYYARITTSSGMIKEIWYDDGGETKQVSINGRVVLKIIKDGHNLIIMDEKGNVTQKDYDEWDNLTGITYPDGTTASFEYEHVFNKPVRMVDQRGTVTTYTYDSLGNVIRKTEAVDTPVERATTYTYNDSGQPLTVTSQGDAHTQEVTVTFTYDANGNIASIRDAEGNTTQLQSYDVMGNLLRMLDPRGNSWTYGYDAMGRMTSEAYPDGNGTSYEYDGANNRTAVINALLKRYGFEYNDHNNRIKATDPTGKFMIFEYNSDNLPTRTTDQEGKQKLNEYDNKGRLIRTRDGAGNETLYIYDETAATPALSTKPVRIDYPTYSKRLYYDNMQRLVRETDILDSSMHYSTSYEYDAAGNLVTRTDAEEHKTTNTYDALNRIITSVDPSGGITVRSYDDRDNLIALKDPKNAITIYEYDRNNRLVKGVRPIGQQTSYEYDTLGNLAAVIDAKGQKIAYEYDSCNRRTVERHYAAGNHSTPVKVMNYTYDALGNLTDYSDGNTSAAYTYDDLQRKTHETVNYGVFSLSSTSSYYANGLKKSFTGPDGIAVGYAYDAGNRLGSVTIPGRGQITYNAYQWNNPARVTLPGGTKNDYVYDPLMRLQSITSQDPGNNVIMSRTYGYSPAGNITANNTEHGDYAYQYDSLYRLTQADNAAMADEAYTYDGLGNRLTAAGTTGTWTYNANNELTGYGDVSVEYDANGNMTGTDGGGQVRNYVYDTANRLVLIETGSHATIAQYYYDPFGRRLWKDVGGTRTCFFYSDEGLAGEYTASGSEISTYGFAPGSQWTTNPLFIKTGGSYYWYQNDHLGTPQKIITSAGQVVWSASYDSFGNCQVNTASITNNLRFPGQYYDAESGLYYNYHRVYDPSIARYLTIDPQGDVLNSFSYVINNPLGMSDPVGLCAIKGWKEAYLGLVYAGYILANPDDADFMKYAHETGYMDTAQQYAEAVEYVSDKSLTVLSIFTPWAGLSTKSIWAAKGIVVGTRTFQGGIKNGLEGGVVAFGLQMPNILMSEGAVAAAKELPGGVAEVVSTLISVIGKAPSIYNKYQTGGYGTINPGGYDSISAFLDIVGVLNNATLKP